MLNSGGGRGCSRKYSKIMRSIPSLLSSNVTVLGLHKSDVLLLFIYLFFRFFPSGEAVASASDDSTVFPLILFTCFWVYCQAKGTSKNKIEIYGVYTTNFG